MAVSKGRAGSTAKRTRSDGAPVRTRGGLAAREDTFETAGPAAGKTAATAGQMIRAQRERLGLTQRQLGDAIGVTDGYVAHMEADVKLPSLNVLLAISDVFDFDVAQQTELQRAVEAIKAERASDRVRKRGAAVRGALRTRGALAPDPGSGEVDISPERLSRDLTVNPRLREAYGYLRTAFAEPHLRETALTTLKALAASAKPR